MITRLKLKKDIAHTPDQVHQACAMKGDFYRDSEMEFMKIPNALSCFQFQSTKEAEGHRLYQASFVGRLKLDGSRRSKLSVAACNDRRHCLSTAAPIICRISIRSLLCVAVLKLFTVNVRYIGKVFVTSRMSLRCPFSCSGHARCVRQKKKFLRVSNQCMQWENFGALVQNIFWSTQMLFNNGVDHTGLLPIILTSRKQFKETSFHPRLLHYLRRNFELPKRQRNLFKLVPKYSKQYYWNWIEPIRCRENRLQTWMQGTCDEPIKIYNWIQ